MNISGKTKLLGLIGSPVDHSMSPAMYNHCFEKFGMDCVYLAFDVDLEHVEQGVEAFRTFGLAGGNVTMPLKNAVIPYLDEVDPAAVAAGAVNTIVNRSGKLYGYITDGMGYTDDLRRGGVDIKGKKLTLLGGGGAASAIAVQAAVEGVRELAIFNIRDEFWERVHAKAETIRELVPECVVNVYDLNDAETLRREIADSDILTNATNVGMEPMEDLSPIKDVTMLRPELIVTEEIYHPVETKLLRDAKAAGCRTFNALGVLLCQGAAAFRLFSDGLEMPLDEVYELFYK